MDRHPSSSRTGALTIAALGVVYGDIGTSPLYALREAFSTDHGIAASPADVLAVLSMVFWAVTIIVSIKYVLVMLRFDHSGEGGVLALMSWATSEIRAYPRLAWMITLTGALAFSLFCGDAVITPAISVLSAVEGIGIVSPGLAHWTVPIALAVLVLLFTMQRHGAGVVGSLFGPVMLVWFSVLALTGALSIAKTPEVLGAISPVHAIRLAWNHPGLAFTAAAAVFLCLTGAEALYADMGHFGRQAVRRAWFYLVFPALMINYFGQGALILRDASAASNPFYRLVPAHLVPAMVVLATIATVIASQAVISGAFSATQQASRLNLLPRLRVHHTSDRERGQIYIPLVNWVLMLFVIVLVLAFGSSTDLASAYGIAVAGDLLLSSLIMLVVLPRVADARVRLLLGLFVLSFALELVFFATNATKFAQGGWVPVAIALAVFTVLTTWRSGTEYLRGRKSDESGGLDALTLDLQGAVRVPGSAIFFSSSRVGVPRAFLHNLKHNKVVHENTAFLTVEFDDLPRVSDDERVVVMRGTNGCTRLIARFGFREDPDIDRVLELAQRKGAIFDRDDISFFTSKPTIVSISRRGLMGWRRSLFGAMMQNSASVATYLKLPSNRVIELGAQVGI